MFAEEWVVRVGTVDRDVVLDALLAVDADLVAVRALDDRNAGREQGEPREISAVDREVLDGTLVYLGRKLGSGGVDSFGVGGHVDGFGSAADLERDVQR